MNLPFARDEFFEVFAAYNRAFWPIIGFFWIVTAAAAVRLLRGRGLSEGWLGFLACQWAWTAIAYHGLYFTTINPAAWLFAAMFLAQAAAMLRLAVVSRPSFRLSHAPRHRLAAALVLYALLYPFLAVISGHDIPRAPLFAVPCPLALLTSGVLLAAETRPARWVFVIPIAWSIVGGSAAILLGVLPDLALFVAGGALSLYAIVPIGRHWSTTMTSDWHLAGSKRSQSR